mgnify:CR=1 FL=1
MAILKFRVYFEEDDSVYRDVVIRHKQSFHELHETILKAFEFDATECPDLFPPLAALAANCNGNDMRPI